MQSNYPRCAEQASGMRKERFQPARFVSIPKAKFVIIRYLTMNPAQTESAVSGGTLPMGKITIFSRSHYISEFV